MVDLYKHLFVPQHSILSDTDKKKLFEKYSVSPRELPKIMKDDPAIKKFNPKSGDVVMIIRNSNTAGKAVYYRVIVDN